LATEWAFFWRQELLILGRPIRLADVLCSFTKLRANEVVNEIDYYGDICFNWDFENDDLREQPPETIDFLHSILCQSSQ
jgi:hypothetical protein